MLDNQTFVCDKLQAFHPFCHLGLYFFFGFCNGVLYHAEFLWLLDL